jgi:predicted transcriptional regulator
MCGGGAMKTVTLEVKSLKDSLREFSRTWKSGKAETTARISFESPELLWEVLTAKRWEILKAMTGQRVLSIREVARRVGRDVKAVHADVHALLDAGVLERTDEGVMFPYEAVHVDFTLTAVA